MINSIKKSAIGSAVTLALMGGAAPALAAPGVFFCATGNSCAGQLVEQFAWQQGSTIAYNGFNNGGSGTVAGAQLRGQGWLGSLVAGGSGTSNNEFFYVFSIDVAVNKTGNTTGSTVTFIDGQLAVPTATTATNYFRIYHQAGFATTANFDAGISAPPAGASLILEGAVFLDDNPNITDPNKQDTPSAVSIGSTSPLKDIGSGSTTQGGKSIDTINTSGGLLLDINVLTSESAYFRSNIDSLNLDLNLSDALSNPFVTVRVPARINGATLPYFGALVGGALINNTTCDGAAIAPCDMIFASNAAPLSTVYAEVIPEPGTVALLGLGLLGLGRWTSRKRS